LRNKELVIASQPVASGWPVTSGCPVPEGRQIVAHHESGGAQNGIMKSPGGAAQLPGRVCRPSGAFLSG